MNNTPFPLCYVIVRHGRCVSGVVVHFYPCLASLSRNSHSMVYFSSAADLLGHSCRKHPALSFFFFFFDPQKCSTAYVITASLKNGSLLLLRTVENKSDSLVFFSVSDHQGGEQRRLPVGQHRLQTGPVSGRALHHHRHRRVRGGGGGAHRLPLQTRAHIAASQTRSDGAGRRTASWRQPWNFVFQQEWEAGTGNVFYWRMS